MSWEAAAITAGVGLLQAYMANKSNKDTIKDQRAYDREKEIRALELEKFRIMMGNKGGGGGGRDKMLELLEQALGVSQSGAALKSQAYGRAAQQAQAALLGGK